MAIGVLGGDGGCREWLVDLATAVAMWWWIVWRQRRTVAMVVEWRMTLQSGRGGRGWGWGCLESHGRRRGAGSGWSAGECRWQTGMDGKKGQAKTFQKWQKLVLVWISAGWAAENPAGKMGFPGPEKMGRPEEGPAGGFSALEKVGKPVVGERKWRNRGGVVAAVAEDSAVVGDERGDQKRWELGTRQERWDGAGSSSGAAEAVASGDLG